MFTVTILGSGKIGHAITALLSLSGRYQIRLCDYDLKKVEAISKKWKSTQPFPLDLANKKACEDIVKGSHAVISALPYHCNPAVAEIVIPNGIHYLDLTEDVQTTHAITKLSASSKGAVIPQCGLAPGFISIAAAHLMRRFESVDSVKMRVGALPIYPSNRLKYNLTWSTEGLINEYGNMCEVITEGKKHLAFPLEGHERFSLDGVEYEAFNTSGGLGTLCDSMEGKVRNLDYKSIRYPGHRDYIVFLMKEMRFNEDRDTLRQVFERSLPTTPQDKCIVLVEVQGKLGGQYVQRTYASSIYNNIIGDNHFGAIQITTASGICTPLDLLLTGKLPRQTGFIRCEEIALTAFLENEFGKYFLDEDALSGIKD